MKYPAIIRNDNEVEMLLLNEDSAIILSEAHKGEVHDVFPRFRRRYVDITHKYLSNTWGVVESKEHAEFIIELAVNCEYSPSFAKRAMAEGSVNWFFFSESENELQFFENDVSDSFYESEGEKQITIPLPPKAKEWVPEVGDEVYVTKKVLDNNSMQEAAELISETYCKLISKFTHNEVEFCVLKNDNSAYTSLILDLCLSDKTIVKLKPKSKQDLLIEELQTKLCNNNAVDNYILACDIINGEIEGLSYEPNLDLA
jgi:hypothetical protein